MKRKTVSTGLIIGFAAISASFALLLSCGGDTAAVQARVPSLEELTSGGLLVPPDADELEVLSVMGVPVSRELIPRTPIHETEPDYSNNLIVYGYSGAQIAFYQVNGGNETRVFLISVALSSDDLLKKYGFTRGMNPGEVSEYFQQSQCFEYEENGVLYLRYCSESEPSGFPSIVFRFENDSLSSMTWEAYLD